MNASNSSLTEKILRTGYDLPVYGLANGQLLYIHIPALTCISLSFICVVIVLTLSFRHRSYKTFFRWTRSERFVVYLALCDGGFNLAHFTDHLHIVIVRNHVYPKELCEFYGFNLAVFISAQNLMVNVVAINAFVLIYFSKQIPFGKKDYKLLLWTFGVPFLTAALAGILGQLGPNGTFCYFDGVKGTIANLFFTTVPLVLILVMNIVLYILTWIRIHNETKRLHLGDSSQLMSANFTAARNMSLFVVAFFIQWWAMSIFGVWAYVAPDNVPQFLFHLVTTFSNIGGILNLVVYLIIRRRLILRKRSLKQQKIKAQGTEMSTIASSNTFSL